MGWVWVICILMWSVQSHATIHTVNVSGLSFTPANITIEQGDTVRWVKTNGVHNIRESGGGPDTVFYSGAPNGAAFTYNFAFNAPLVGLYNYRCDVHFSVGMVGTVTVNPPPCLDPSDLVAKWETVDQVDLYWNAPAAGTYDVYSTTDATLATAPPGPGWTLVTSVVVGAPGQATTQVVGLVEKMFFIVVQNCAP